MGWNLKAAMRVIGGEGVMVGRGKVREKEEVVRVTSVTRMEIGRERIVGKCMCCDRGGVWLFYRKDLRVW